MQHNAQFEQIFVVVVANYSTVWGISIDVEFIDAAASMCVKKLRKLFGFVSDQVGI